MEADGGREKIIECKIPVICLEYPFPSLYDAENRLESHID